MEKPVKLVRLEVVNEGVLFEEIRAERMGEPSINPNIVVRAKLVDWKCFEDEA